MIRTPIGYRVKKLNSMEKKMSSSNEQKTTEVVHSHIQPLQEVATTSVQTLITKFGGGYQINQVNSKITKPSFSSLYARVKSPHSLRQEMESQSN